MLAGMKLKTSDGAVVDIEIAEVLRAAGVIYQARRKTCAGPARVYPCRWCSSEIRGRVAREQHERSCAQQPTGELDAFTPTDMAALGWTPLDAVPQ